MRLLFLGPPGSGKGTQAKHIVEQTHCQYIASGDMLREAVAKKTELGLKAKQFMDAGELVPDNLIIDMIRDTIMRQSGDDHAFLLDGFPRTIPQAEALDEMLGNIGLELEKVFNLEVRDEVIVKRITGRRICRKCGRVYNVYVKPPNKDGSCPVCGGATYQRDDDNVETVQRRLDVYHRQTKPLLEYYKRQNIIIDIEGEGEIEEIWQRIEAHLEL